MSAQGEPRYEPAHDEEAWATIPAGDDDPRAVLWPLQDAFRAYLTERGLDVRTLLLETFPQVIASRRRRRPRTSVLG